MSIEDGGMRCGDCHDRYVSLVLCLLHCYGVNVDSDGELCDSLPCWRGVPLCDTLGFGVHGGTLHSVLHQNMESAPCCVCSTYTL